MGIYRKIDTKTDNVCHVKSTPNTSFMVWTLFPYMLTFILSIKNKKQRKWTKREKWSWRKSISVFVYRTLWGQGSVSWTSIYLSTYRGTTKNTKPKIIVFETGRKNEILGERYFLSLSVSLLAQSMFIYGLKGHTSPALWKSCSPAFFFFFWWG